MATAAVQTMRPLAQSPSLDLFLQTLLGDGRISEIEYSTAIALIQKEQQQRRQTRIPGAITLSYSALPSNQLATVHAVFNTRELIEHIFSYLDTKDLINSASRTCRGFRNIVSTTPAIRRQLFLQPDLASALRTPAIKNIHYKITHEYVEILIVNAGQLLNSSTTLQEILLAQPPIKTTQIFYDCSCRSRDPGVLTNENGLRFGDISTALNEHFIASQASQHSYRRCTCRTYNEARLIFRIVKPEAHKQSDTRAAMAQQDS